ncbi:MAG TPA: hypothetical protein VGQ84_14725 [Gaiellaceae bacterium]|nr:hypothetical protein [Gaiellaceae bacterium]
MRIGASIGSVQRVNKAEAREVARTKATELRELGWSQLRERYLDRPETIEVVGDSGTTYQVQTLAVWDGGDEGNLRVFVAVDDGGWRAFVPLSEDFIVAPDDSFVGE